MTATPAVRPADSFLARLDAIAPELEAIGDEIEETGRQPARLRELLVEGGWMRLTLPSELGGSGLTFSEYVRVLERVAGFHGAIRMYVHGMNGLWRPMVLFGTEAQKRQWLPRHHAGDVLAFALTEAETGSGRDVGTTATLEGDTWVLSGTKSLISFAAESAVLYVVAATGVGADGQREISCILVPRDAPGLTITPLPEGMGCRGTSHDRVVLDRCRVPAANLLGRRGEGLEVAIRGFLDVSRVGIATSALGLAQRAFDLACEFARSRVTFGRPISERQAIQMQVGEMASELYALRCAIENASGRFDAGLPIVAEAAMCKLLGIEIVGRVTDAALRIHGGIGYTRAHRIERMYRDARALWFEEGTAEIQKLVIARPHLR